MRLREVEAADLAPLAQLHTRIWQQAYRGMVPDELLDGLDWRDRDALWRRWFEGGNPSTWLLAEVDDELVGHVLAGPVEPGHGELHLLYLDSSQWGTGLGEELLRVGERILRRHGCVSAELWTFETNERSQAFYGKHGWDRDGRTKLDEEILPGHPIVEVALAKRLDVEAASLNSGFWATLAAEFVDYGETAWSSAPSWGIFANHETELGLLTGVEGADVVEVGCGTAYVSKWCLDAGARSVVGIDVTSEQLATAVRLQREHDTAFPLLLADGQRLPFPDESFDFAISEYGAAIWCDPHLWIPEAARVLRPGGRLVFLGNSLLVMLCGSEWEGVPATDRLLRPQAGLHRIDWFDCDGVEFHVSHGEMIGVITAAGLRVDALHELYARPETEASFGFVTAEWAQKWPAEEVWVAVKE